MKRRSATRPVVVEVKRTRSSISSLAGAFGRNRSSKDLWQGLPLRAEMPAPASQKPQKPSVVLHEPVHDAEPVRRVLPSLAPAFVLHEPEHIEDTPKATSRSPRVAMVKRRHPTSSRVEPEVTSPVELIETVSEETSSVVPHAPVELPVSATVKAENVAPPCLERGNRVWRREAQGDAKLRRGEHWKRRLPRFCR